MAGKCKSSRLGVKVVTKCGEDTNIFHISHFTQGKTTEDLNAKTANH